MNILQELKEKIYKQDNTFCFIERDRILDKFEKENAENKESDRFAKAFAAVLAGISVPIEDEDVFVGRMVEGAKEKDINSPNSKPAGVAANSGFKKN